MMKRNRTTLISAIALISLVCLGLTFAQMDDNDGDRPGENGKAWRQMKWERIFNRLVDGLGLTEEQADELKAIFEEHHESMRELKDALRDVLRLIREELAKDEPDEEELARLSAQANAIREQMEEERDAFKTRIDEFKSGLTITQQAKFLLFEARMHGRRFGHHPRRENPRDEKPLATPRALLP